MRQLLNTKKGMSLEDMYPAVLTITLIGLMLGVGIYVLTQFHDQVLFSYSGSQNAINTSAGTTTLTDASLSSFNLTSVTAVVYTNGTTVGTNYTYTNAGVITWGANIVADQSSKVNVSYTYKYDAANSPGLALTTTITGIGGFANWVAIIVVVIAAAIVLGVVLSSFGRRSAI